MLSANLTVLYSDIEQLWNTDKNWINTQMQEMFNHTYFKTPSEEYFL